MRGLGTGIFLLWIYLLQIGSSNYAEILRGQCYAFCLTRHEARQKDRGGESELPVTKSAIRECRRDRICKGCLFACERPREDYVDHEDCQNDCEISRIRRRKEALQACNGSCSFVAQASQSKFGHCVAQSEMEGFRRACIEECERDIDCDGMDKCCDNGCGKTCQKPVESSVFPPIPAKLEFKERRDGAMVIEWEEKKDKTIIEPIVYILRWWCHYTNGVLHEITTRPRIKLKGHPKGVHPGAECNFMVAAINIHGSVGFSRKHTHRKKFVKPSPPLNLEKTRSKLQDGKVDVTIRWQPPRYTDGLPIKRYLVFWSGDLPRASTGYTRLHMHKKTLNAQKTSYTIQNLKPGKVYFVQVRAIVKWDDKSIHGKPSSIHIETNSFPQPPGPEEVPSIYNISIHEPTFINSQLRVFVTWSLNRGSNVKKYMLYWTLDMCDGEAKHRKTKDRIEQEATTNKKEFLLYNLQSNCVYEVRIHTVNFFGDMDRGYRDYFSTPPCWETKGADVGDVCPPKVSPPLPPTDLSVRFRMKSNCVCQAVISWSQPSGNNRKISQFSILWGESRPPPGDGGARSLIQSSTIVYTTVPHKRQIPGTDFRACMTYLESDKHYTVQIISHVAKIKSPPAVLHFVTPASFPPCYGSDLNGVTDLNSDGADFLGSIERPDVERTTSPAAPPHQHNGSLSLRISWLWLCLMSLLCWLRMRIL